jgi:hypothetical protein
VVRVSWNGSERLIVHFESINALTVLDFSSYFCLIFSTDIRLMIQGSAYRFIAGFVIVLIPILTIVILPLVLILIISVICIMQILLDLRLHPHHRIF